MASGDSLGKVVKRRLLGLLFIALVISLISLSIAIYNKAFSTFTDVTLKSDFTGNELQKDSDVKIRGLLVGSVASIDSTGDGAVVKIKLDPAQAKKIPADVTAQILPKTLFGEQYVALSTPEGMVGPGVPSIRAGDVIPQDRSKGALESQHVLSDLYPLLSAVQPAQLNATLTALATALHNRGNKLGETLVNFDKYLKVMNPHTAQLVKDLKNLGNVALEYNNVLPDVYSTLQNFQTGVRTIVQKQAGLNALLVNGADTSNVLRGFLADNEQRIIGVSDTRQQDLAAAQRVLAGILLPVQRHQLPLQLFEEDHLQPSGAPRDHVRQHQPRALQAGPGGQVRHRVRAQLLRAAQPAGPVPDPGQVPLPQRRRAADHRSVRAAQRFHVLRRRPGAELRG